jgi:hypothetical protein
MRDTTFPNVRIGAAVIAVSAAFLLAFQATNSAFSSQTDNTGNAFAAGTVTLTDDDSGTAMFDATGMTPGDTVVGCIEVTYSGSLDPEVRLFGATTAGDGLEAYLDLTVERGNGSCSSFGSSTAVWTNGADGDMGVFFGSAVDYATGADDWQPNGGAPDDTVPYRFTVTLQDNNAAQGKTVTATFTWEAQNL